MQSYTKNTAFCPRPVSLGSLESCQTLLVPPPPHPGTMRMELLLSAGHTCLLLWLGSWPDSPCHLGCL